MPLQRYPLAIPCWAMARSVRSRVRHALASVLCCAIGQAAGVSMACLPLQDTPRAASRCGA
eukprot:3427351-Prorocentrum_lima.AAC.1